MYLNVLVVMDTYICTYSVRPSTFELYNQSHDHIYKTGEILKQSEYVYPSGSV